MLAFQCLCRFRNRYPNVGFAQLGLYAAIYVHARGQTRDVEYISRLVRGAIAVAVASVTRRAAQSPGTPAIVT